MKIRSKLNLAFLINLCFIFAVGITGILYLEKVGNLSTDIYDKNLVPIYDIENIQDLSYTISFGIHSHITSEDPDQFNKLEETIKNNFNLIHKALLNIKQTHKDVPSLPELLSVLNSSISDYEKISDKVINLSREFYKEDAMRTMHAEADTSLRTITDLIKRIMSILKEYASDSLETSRKNISTSTWSIIFVIIIGSILSLLNGFYVSNLITKPISKAVDYFGKLANGDTKIKLDISRKDETGILSKAFNDIVDVIANLINEAKLLTKAAAEGRLSVRGDASKFHGDYAGIIEDLNNTLDQIVGPLTVSAGYIDRISNGDIPDKISEQYSGDFQTINSSINRLISNLQQVIDQAMMVAKGDLSSEISLLSDKDELGSALKLMNKSLTDVVRQANEISKGNYSVNISPRSDKDDLGKALSHMTSELRKATEENMKSNWLKTGQMELNNIIRGEQDLQTLSRNIVNFIAKYINAQIGALYIADENKVMKMAGSYAYPSLPVPGKEAQFVIGEGILGEAALQKETILLKNVPADYIKVTSGFGESKPVNIIALPLIYEGEVMGVIELGALKEYSKTELDFLGQISENIAIFLNSAQSRHHVSKLLRETISQSKKLELLSRYKSEFLANMSHEIRTPMNAVIGMTSLTLDTEVTDEQRDYLQTVLRSAHDLLDIINDILDYSKIEAGKFSVDLIDFNLRLIVEELADTLAAQVIGSELEIGCIMHHDVPSLLQGDPTRIRQVLLNLGSNAVKFTKKGEVIIKVELINESDTQAKIHFSVTDTGIGIPEEKSKIIFEDFMQADGSTTREYGGTGLGLSICKKLIEIMDGEIGVHSIPGKGCTFWFDLTFNKQKESSVAVTTDIYSDIRGTKVLIVDDNKSNRKILLKMLEGFGCVSEAVESGPKAIDILIKAGAEGHPFKIALLDMMMPGMDGEHLSIIIKNTPDIRDTILILLTSLGSRGDILRLKEIGCSAYLIKPVKQSILLETMLTALNKSSGVSKDKSDIITRHSINEKKFMNIRILLVEDNPVNQKMASTLLRKAGYTVDIAENGSVAVAMVDRNYFDIILMDIQMPVMNGFEATKAIRNLEGDSRHSIIIAMTAHAMEKDREKCLEVGMDDYTSKPINPQALLQKIKNFAKLKITEKAPGKTIPHSPGAAETLITADSSQLEVSELPIDMKSVLLRFGNDIDYFKEMAHDFIRIAPEHIRIIEDAAQINNGEAIIEYIHEVKDAADKLSAGRLLSLTSKIEKMAVSGKASDIQGLTQYLYAEIDKIKGFLHAHKI